MSRKTKHFAAHFFVCLIVIVVDSKNDCLTRFCGKNKSLPIHYPFQYEGDKHQKGCDQNQTVNLKCNDQENLPVLNLPSSGDFYVRNINYTAQIIQLYDPNNCLPALFMNSNFSISPLMAISYQNYTFYNCPLNYTTSSNFDIIGCLSNTSISISATSSIVRAREMNNLGCVMIQTVQIPVSSPLQYEYNGFSDNLMLTWDVPDCKVCENTAKHKRYKYNPGITVAVAISPLLLPFVVLLIFYLFRTGFRVVKKIRNFVKWNLNAIASRARKWSVREAQVAPIPSQIRLPVVAALPRRVDIF